MTFSMQRFIQRGIACLALVTVLSGSTRAAVSLSNLINNNGSLIVGSSLRFDSFTYAPSGTAPSANSVTVDAITDANGNYGIRLVGGFVDHTGNGASTMYLTYHVTSLIANQGISGAGLAGNPAVIGLGLLTISEGFQNLPTLLEIHDSVPGTTKLLDSALLPSIVPSLAVSVSVVGDSRKGATTMSFFDNTFGQATNNVVPEPTSALIWLGTLSLGGVGLAGYRRHTSVQSFPGC